MHDTTFPESSDLDLKFCQEECREWGCGHEEWLLLGIGDSL